MDPIAAYRAQQERLGLANVQKSIPQLRAANPRWATIFDTIDTSNDGLLQLDEVTAGFQLILGAGSDVPERQIQKVFEEVDVEGTGDLNFRHFCELCKKVSGHMMDNPKWAENEAKAREQEEKERLAAEKARKLKEGPDIFAVLGIKKSKDLVEAEAKKKCALQHAASERKDSQARKSISLAGATIVRTGSAGAITGNGASGSRPTSASDKLAAGANFASLGAIGGPNGLMAKHNKSLVTPAMSLLGARRFAAGLKRSQPSIESVASEAVPEDEEEPISPTKKLRDMWDRFSLSSARGRTSKALGNVRQIHLGDNLPQVRALGKRNAGCFSLRFNPDGSMLAGGFFDGGVRIYDVDKAQQVHCMNLPKYKGGSVKSVEEREQDDFLKLRSDSGEAPQPMAVDEEVDVSSVVKKWEPVTSVRWMPGGGRMDVLASVDTKGVCSLWDVPRAKETRPSRCLGSVDSGGPLTSLAWLSDGSGVAVGGGDKSIKIYDVTTDTGKASFMLTHTLGQSVAFCGKCTGHALKITSLCAHPTTPQVLVSAGLDRNILVWDIRAGVCPVHQVYGPELAGDSVDISRDGNSVLCGSHRSKNPLEIHDLRMNEDAKPSQAYCWRGNEESTEGGGRWTTCLLFTAGWDSWENKTIVAAGENENLARVYERSAAPDEPLRIVGTVRGKGQGFWSSAISTDGRNVAFGSSDGAVCLVDVNRK